MVNTAITISNTAYAPARQGNEELRNALGESAARLTSGNRIIRIADDVRAVTQAAELQSQSAGFRQAATNASEGASLLEVAAAGLDDISAQIETLQALATQSTGTSLTDTQRALLQEQFNGTINDIDTIVQSTTFNGTSPLAGFSATFRIGPQASDAIDVTISDVSSDALFGGAPPDIGSIANATAAQTALDDANNIVQGAIRYVQGVQQGFYAAAAALAQTEGGSLRASSDLVDTNITDELKAQRNNSILLNSSTALLAQATNLEPQLLQLLNSASVAVAAQPAQEPTDEETQDGTAVFVEAAATAAAAATRSAQSAASSSNSSSSDS